MALPAVWLQIAVCSA